MSKSYKFAWSYSALSNFENCPMKWAYQSYYREVPYKEGEAQKWGNKVHKAMELRCRDGKPLPKDCAGFERYALNIDKQVSKGAKLTTEKRMGINRDYQPTGYFGDDIYGRCQADVVLVKGGTAFLGDWKTGGVRSRDAEQLKVGCFFLSCYMPKIQEFKVKLIGLKEGVLLPKAGADRFTKQEIRDFFHDEYLPRIKRMEETVKLEAFDYRPNPLCGWCGANELGLCSEATCEYKGG